MNQDQTDDDNPEWTADDFAAARPASEVLPPPLAKKPPANCSSHGAARVFNSPRSGSQSGFLTRFWNTLRPLATVGRRGSTRRCGRVWGRN